MGAYYDEFEDIEQPKTLTYWVRNFRMKRVQMRRKMRGSGSLRVNAILSTALNHAEDELRRKQQERFSRWIDIQTKFVPHGRTHCASDANEKYERNCVATLETETAEEFERRNVENNLWRSELSGLDSFLSSLSSSSSNNSNNHSHNNNNCSNITNNISNNGSSNNYNNNQHHCAIAVHS